MRNKMGFIDITMPFKNGMAHYPGDPPFMAEPLMCLEDGDDANLMRLCFGTHTGTHFDAPYHMIADGKKADEYPADYFCGRARVAEFLHNDGIERKNLTGAGIKAGDIVLLKTQQSANMCHAQHDNRHVSLEASAARYLADMRIRALGIDCMSIECGPGFEAHHILLGVGIPIIEGLYLHAVRPGLYRMTAMFLNITGADAAPLRAILHKD